MFLPAKVPTVSVNNPLLQSYDLPPFSTIRAEHVLPAIETILADNRVAIAEILKSQGQNPTWAGLVLAMDELNDRLGAAWSPVSHLNAVCNSAELRESYEACLQALIAYSTEMGQNRELFQAFEALAHSPQVGDFDQAQKTILEHRQRHALPRSVCAAGMDEWTQIASFFSRNRALQCCGQRRL